jgi:hypothetical protein
MDNGDGNLTVVNLSVVHNWAHWSGAGIANQDSLVLQNSSLSGNVPDDLDNTQGTAIYVLPAPLGHYVDGAVTCASTAHRGHALSPPSVHSRQYGVRTLCDAGAHVRCAALPRRPAVSRRRGSRAPSKTSPTPSLDASRGCSHKRPSPTCHASAAPASTATPRTARPPPSALAQPAISALDQRFCCHGTAWLQ